jgi:hypothetical protein
MMTVSTENITGFQTEFITCLPSVTNCMKVTAIFRRRLMAESTIRPLGGQGERNQTTPCLMFVLLPVRIFCVAITIRSLFELIDSAEKSALGAKTGVWGF